MSDLIKAYSGRSAARYDARRSRSKRWRAEVAAMNALLDLVKPHVVLDCPFGTGRWLPDYEARDIEVIGLDLSADMLATAKEKIAELPAERQARYDLRQANIFELTPDQSERAPDLVVCVRFVNWVTLDEARLALKNLSGLGSDRMLVGASVIPVGQTSVPATLTERIKGFLRPANRDPRPQYVHPEAELLAAFSDLGWRVEDKRFIFRGKQRENYFYLLARA